MSSDRDKPRRHQTQTERDLDGLKARKERDSRPRDQVDELAEAVQSDGTPDEFEDIDTGVTPELAKLIRADPVARVFEAKLRHERSRRASDILKALGSKPPAERMSAFERTLRNLRWIVVAVAIPAASSTLLVVKYLMARSATEERARIELEQLHAHDVEYEARIRSLELLAGKNAQRIDDFVRGRRRDSNEPDVAPRRDPTPTRGTQ